MINVLFTIFLTLILSACGMCRNEISNTKTSPNGDFKAVVFNRNCGATTGFNTQVSILNKNQALPNDGGNVFIMDSTTNIIINWQSNSKLEISGNLSNEIIKQNSEHQGVQVVYKNTTI